MDFGLDHLFLALASLFRLHFKVLGNQLLLQFLVLLVGEFFMSLLFPALLCMWKITHPLSQIDYHSTTGTLTLRVFLYLSALIWLFFVHVFLFSLFLVHILFLDQSFFFFLYKERFLLDWVLLYQRWDG